GRAGPAASLAAPEARISGPTLAQLVDDVVGHVEIAAPDADAQVRLVGPVVVGPSSGHEAVARRQLYERRSFLRLVATVDGLEPYEPDAGQLPNGVVERGRIQGHAQRMREHADAA